LQHEHREELATGDTKGQFRRLALSASYNADKRTHSWMKLKRDYVEGTGDSLDLVPIGAWHGNGRKKDWWSPILLGVHNPSTGRLVAVCKCMSGEVDIFKLLLSAKVRFSRFLR
jgi:DNA ligase 1